MSCRRGFCGWVIFLGFMLVSPNSQAQLKAPPPSEEETFSPSPFTEYGEFNDALSEEAETEFFQYGRFFGVSLGLGYQFLGGNRALLWQGGFPRFEIKVHYWFDFQFALDLGLSTVSHYYLTSINNQGQVSVTLFTLGVHLRYYIDTRNLSAAISFINPYLLGGLQSYTKTQNASQIQSIDTDTSGGLNFGAGLEFTLSARKTYLQCEGKIHLLRFNDTYTTLYQQVGLKDLTGNFYTFSTNLLFTW